MGETINSITVGELFAIMSGCVAIFLFLKYLIVPLVGKWLKVENNSKKLKELPEIIATQQRQIDDMNSRLERGNLKFETLERDVLEIKTELASNNILLETMNTKLDLLVEDRIYSQPASKNSELLKGAYEENIKAKLAK